MGSLIGAASAKPSREVSPFDPPTAVVGASTAEPTYSIARHYWMAFLILSVISVSALAAGFTGTDRVLGAMIVLAMVLPGVQLAASLVALVITAVSKRPGKEERLSHLGRITVRSVLGALIGLAIMFVAFQVLR